MLKNGSLCLASYAWLRGVKCLRSVQGDDEQSEAETNGEEGEDAREDVNMADIDQRFIVEKTQRQAAAKAAEETSKLLHDDVNPAPGATATTAPVAKATTPAKNKQPADKKVCVGGMTLQGPDS